MEHMEEDARAVGYLKGGLVVARHFNLGASRSCPVRLLAWDAAYSTIPVA
jgi:hypothetical protein